LANNRNDLAILWMTTHNCFYLLRKDEFHNSFHMTAK